MTYVESKKIVGVNGNEIIIQKKIRIFPNEKDTFLFSVYLTVFVLPGFLVNLRELKVEPASVYLQKFAGAAETIVWFAR